MVGMVWNGKEFERVPFMQVPERIRREENVFRCVPASRAKKLRLVEKTANWCSPQGEHMELTRVLNLHDYVLAADKLAALSNWTNRSE
jgi:hypothetical protein